MDIDQLLNGNDSNRKFTDFFEFKAIVGKGAFGTVVHAVDLTTKEEVAIKVKLISIQIINKLSLRSIEFDQLRKEAFILSQLKHPNIVRFIDVKETDSRILIIMELIRGGSLAELIDRTSRETTYLTEDQCRSVMKQILKGISYVHQQNVIHRDLKPENILISDDLTSVKITDFGLSAGFRDDQTVTLQKQCGTMIYMAPEQLEGRVYNKAVDVWSCGVILYKLLLKGKHPYYQSGDGLDVIKDKIKSMQSDVYTSLTQMQYSLFSRLTQPEPQNRYFANQALLHPWIDQQCVDVPMVMPEMVRSFQLKDTFPYYIKVILLLLKFGWKIKLEHASTCEQFAQEHKQEITKVHKREGKIEGLAKEFYDDLFEKYQANLSEPQKLQVAMQIRKQSMESQLQTYESSIRGAIAEKFQFIIKTTKRIEEKNESPEHTQEYISPIDYGTENRINTNNDNQDEIPKETAYMKQVRKRSPRNKKVKNLTISRQESINTPQSLAEDHDISQTNSPSKIPQRNQGGSKFKIQLKPLNSTPQPEFTNNEISQTLPQKMEMPMIKPKFQPQIQTTEQPRPIQPNIIIPKQRQRAQNYSVEQSPVKIVHANILDLTAMAMGDMSPVANNQFLFQTRRNGSLPQQTTHYKRVYANEFHPSKILSHSNKKYDVNIYNFINGGPK